MIKLNNHNLNMSAVFRTVIAEIEALCSEDYITAASPKIKRLLGEVKPLLDELEYGSEEIRQTTTRFIHQINDDDR